MLGAGYLNVSERTVDNGNVSGSGDNDNGDGDNRDNDSSGGDVVNRVNDDRDTRGNDDGEGDSDNDVATNNNIGGGIDQVTTTFISLPSSIQNKRGTLNPQNNDRQCFKWSILAKHVTGHNRCRIGDNYHQHSHKYDFTGLSFPTPLCEVKIFERKNSTVSINVYGVEKKTNSPLKSSSHIVFPLKVIDEEKVNHFDLLYITENENAHYIYISNFS